MLGREGEIVQIQAVAQRTFPREKRGPMRTTHRDSRNRVGEIQALRRQSIQIRRRNLAVAVQRTDIPVPHVVCQDKDHVGLLRRCGVYQAKPSQCQDDQSAAAIPFARHNLLFPSLLLILVAYYHNKETPDFHVCAPVRSG